MLYVRGCRGRRARPRWGWNLGAEISESIRGISHRMSVRSFLFGIHGERNGGFVFMDEIAPIVSAHDGFEA